jgi:uncharacterized protein
MMISPIITAQTLRNALMCERRIWLDEHGDLSQRDSVPPDTMHQYVIGIHHEQTIHDNTLGPTESIPVTSWEEGLSVTRDLMRQGVKGIVGAYLEVETPLDLTDRVFSVRGKVDQLLRQRDGIYSPIEIKQHAEPQEADWVQLDFYVWLLSLIQGKFPSAELWLGLDLYGQPRVRLEHEYDEDRLMAVLAQITETFNKPAEPPVLIKSHCKTCHWYSSCVATAQAEGHVELLYRVSRKTCENLKAAGVTTLAQVAALSPDDLQQIKGIGPITAPIIRANAQAWVEKRPVWHDKLQDECYQGGWMFDLETLESGQPWSLGWCDTQGQTHIALVAPVSSTQMLDLLDGHSVILASSSQQAWRVFAEAMATQDDRIYHWTGFDAGVLRGTAPRDVRERLDPRMRDLHHIFTHAVSLPLGSTSIKAVSAYLGFPWPGYNHWLAAYLHYREWLESGNLDALTRACMYQRADVQSMAWVWRWLVTQ